jgi:outer membrane protein insertion porin family
MIGKGAGAEAVRKGTRARSAGAMRPSVCDSGASTERVHLPCPFLTESLKPKNDGFALQPDSNSRDGGPGRIGKLIVTRHARVYCRFPPFALFPGLTRRTRLAKFVIPTLACLSAVVLDAPHCRAAALPSLWGRTVVSIKLEPDANLRLSDFPGAIVQQTGQPLEQSKVATSLKNLFATGRFEQITADAEPDGSGVRLTFRAKAQYFVGIVRVIDAPKGVDAATLASVSGLRLGQPITDDALTRAEGRIVTVLASSAYYDAQVRAGELRHPESEEADVTLTVVAGPAARLEGVDFLGTPQFSPATLLRAAGWTPGIQLTSTRLEKGLARLRKFYAKQDHLQASVNTASRTYISRNNRERLAVNIAAGARIRIRVEGAKISGSDLRSILPAYREASADEISLLQGEKALQNYFELKGYYSVQVKLRPREAASARSLDIIYSVNLGPKGTFEGYGFRGNHSMSETELSTVVPLQPAGFFWSRRGNFDRGLLDQSVQALTLLYESRGYLDAKITPSVLGNYEGRANSFYVTFNISEGPQTRVLSLTITGLEPTVEKQVRATLTELRGRPYSPELARDDRDAILSYMADRGYSQATVELHASQPSAAHEVALNYDVNPGPQQTVKRVVVIGNDFTRDGVIDRRLTIQAGRPLNESAMLLSQQRLYDLGLFNQVQVATQNPDEPSAEKTVLVGLEEAKRWTVGYGGGLDVQRLPDTTAQGKYGFSPRIALSVDRINLGGRPQSFSVGGHYSNLEKIGSSTYNIPNFLNRSDLDFRVNLVADQSRNVLTFNSRRQEGSVTVQKRYSAHSSLLVRYDFRHVTVSNLQINPASVPLLSQGVLVATIGGGYVNDHRDNPLNATRGSYSAVDADIAWTGFGSSADFARVIAQNSTYYRLGSHLVFARNTRIGFEPTFGQTSPSDGVPLPERFFMGGADSDRGFGLNQAGPRDPITGFPLGGRGLFLNQVELRIPLAQDRLGFVLFEDAGNVFSSYGRFKLLKFTQRSPSDFDYNVQAAGIGLRYRTPVGPLRFDVAYSPNIPSYYACTDPNVPVCPGIDVEVLRLPRIQFSLSIGQSF